MAQAVLGLFPGAQYAIGPAIEDGFYYDFAVGRAFTPEDLEAIETRMAEIVAADQPFEREVVGKAAALEVFAAQPFKREIIEGVEEAEGRRRSPGDPLPEPGLRRSLPGPPPSFHREAGGLQAAAHRRGLLAG